MTYRRDPGDPLDALYEAVLYAPGGLSAAAHAVGLSPSTLRQQLERHTETHQLQFKTYRALLRYLHAIGRAGWPRSLEALAWENAHMAIPVPEIGDSQHAELTQLVVKMFQEGGDVAREIQKDLADGRLTTKEGKSIEREIEQVMEVCASLLQRVRQIQE